MRAERSPRIVRRCEVETASAEASPRLLTTDIDGDGNSELLVGVHKLHVLDALGSSRWEFDLSGDLKAISVGHTGSCCSLIAAGTSRYLDIVLSPADAIACSAGEGRVYCLSSEGELISETCLDEMVSAVSVVNSARTDRLETYVGTGGIGPKPVGKIMLLKRDGTIAWKRPTRSPVSVLLAYASGEEIVHVLAGTEQGKLLALSQHGDLMWQYKVGSEQIVNIRVAISVEHEERVVVGLRDGTSAAFSLVGVLLWQRSGGSPVISLCCADLDRDAEDELVVAHADAIRCYSLSGALLWMMPSEDCIVSLDSLGGQQEDGMQLLVCTGSKASFVSGSDGSIISETQIGDHVLTCRAIQDAKQPGWAVCVSRPAQNPLRKLLGRRKIELVILAQ
jgi:hypothetical protein